jgi:alcohol dehydrogenase (cytochrome c)
VGTLQGALRMAAAALVFVASAAQAQGLFAADPAAKFTADQATRGQAVYSRVCVSCHGSALEGSQFGVPLKGDVFESHWRGQTRAALSEKIRTTMPPRGLGSVSGQAYTDIEAFILQSNGLTAAAGASSASAEPPPEPARIVGSEAETRRQPSTRRGDAGPLYNAAMDARAAKLAAVSPVTDAMLQNPSPNDWMIWRRTYSGLGYSPLKQINRANVKNLRAAWSWALPESMNEITPLIHDGVMFVHSGPVVQALDAVSGELLWQYLRILPDEFDNGRPSRVKTLAIYGEKIFAPTADGHMVALDVRTGKVLWDQKIITEAERAMNGKAEGVALHLNGGPIVAKGKVIMGVSLGLENSKGGCFILGLDVDTGKESWRFHTIARPGEPGGDSWNGAPVEERFGAGVWTVGSYDPELDLVYFGTGTTYDTATLLAPRAGATAVTNNDGLYTNSTLALRPATGQLVWYYQHVKRDVWDLDWVFEQSLATVKVDGKPRKVVITGGKTAMFDAVDAATGKWVFTRDMGIQNLVIAVDAKTGEKTINPAVQPEVGKMKLLCPSASGGRNWPATSLNPETGMLFVPMIESCTDYGYAPRAADATAAGGADMRFAARLPPGTDGKFGRLAALDLQTQQIVWAHRQRMPVAGATLATGGGLVFNGDMDRYFYAYDQKTGDILWRTRLNAAPESFPVTYVVNGRQYIAVVAGGGSAFGAGAKGMVPELLAPAAGVTLTVFELP